MAKTIPKTDPNETPLDGTGGKPSAREILASQMFAVTGHEATLSNLNTRSEKHGEDDVPAADVKLVLVGPHSLLKPFGESLIDFLFREPGVGEDVQGALDLGGDRRTKVRHPKLKPLQHTDEFPGYVVTLSAGLETSTPQAFKDAKVRGFTFRPMDSGAVEITLTASVYPDEHQAGVLFGWQRKTLLVTLEPPKAT